MRASFFSAYGEPIKTNFLQYILHDKRENKSEVDFRILVYILGYKSSKVRFSEDNPTYELLQVLVPMRLHDKQKSRIF